MTTGNAYQIKRRYGVGWMSEAWELFKLAPLTWIGALIGAWIAQTAINVFVEMPIQNSFTEIGTAIHGGASRAMQPWQWALLPFVCLVQMLVASYISSGCLRMALGAMRRRVVHVEDVFSGWPCTLRLFGYNIVNAICIMILCGAPGAAIVYCVFNHGNLGLSVAIIAISTLVIVATLVFSTFVMMGQLLVVEGTSVFEAYKQVFTTMRPHYGAILGAVTVMVLLCLASMCTFFLAGFVLAPMWLILQALVGRDTLGISAGPESLPPNWLSPGSEGPPGAWPPPPKV